MKKTIVILLILMNVVSVDASSNDPKYKIIANSNNETDIKEMYKIKDNLIVVNDPTSYTVGTEVKLADPMMMNQGGEVVEW